MYIRVGVIGPYACGKSTLIERLAMVSRFQWEPELELIAATYAPEVNVVKTGSAEMMFIDTAGQERFKAISACFLRGCDIVLSCQEASHYIAGTKEYLGIGGEETENILSMVEYGQHCRLITVLTKSDLCNLADLEPFAEEHVVTSAYDRDSLTFLLKVLGIAADELAETKKRPPDTHAPKPKEGSCC